MNPVEKIKSMVGMSTARDTGAVQATTGKSHRMIRIDGQWVEVDPATGQPLAKGNALTTSENAHSAQVPPSADAGALSVVAPTLVAPQAGTKIEAKSGDVDGQELIDKKSVGESNIDTRDAQVEETSPAVDGDKEIQIDVESLKAICLAIQEHTKHDVEMIGAFNALEGMVEHLNSDIVAKLGTTTSQLETSNTELVQLRREASERINVVDRLSRENASLKDKCEGYDGIIANKDSQISQAANDLNAEKEKVKAKDAEIERLNKAHQDAVTAHADEIAKLKSAHEVELTEIEKKHGEEVDALNSNAAEQIEAVRVSVNKFVPSEVCDLFDYRVGDPVDDNSRWQAIYAYLCFINGNLRPEAFVKRFREFDAAFYDAMRDSPDLLTECRIRVQKHINDELGKKTGGLLVCWPKVGESCNPDLYTTTSDFGQRISEVISAMIYKKGDGGKVLCQSKGKVATA